jgi:hypothetical protein
LSAFSSFRDDSKGTEGISSYSHLHGLIPRLGFFNGNESRIPVDFGDIIWCIAPRSLLIIAPEQDRHHPIATGRKTMPTISEKYNQAHSSDKMTFLHPGTYNHYPNNLKQVIAEWLLKTKNNN